MSKQFPEDMKSISAFYVFSLPKHNATLQADWMEQQTQDSFVCTSRLGIITTSTEGKSTAGDSIL